VIEDASHALFPEQPDAVASAIISYHGFTVASLNRHPDVKTLSISRKNGSPPSRTRRWTGKI
jgi:hypothetical protein